MQVLLRRPLQRLVMAVIWMVLSDSYRLWTLMVGFVMATLVIWLFPSPVFGIAKRPFQGLQGFLRWSVSVKKLVGFFFWQVLVANWQAVRLALSPKPVLTPGIIRMDLKARTRGQIALLAAMISPTPGTLVMGMSKENDAIFIHCLDASNEAEALRVPRLFEAMVMEVIPD